MNRRSVATLGLGLVGAQAMLVATYLVVEARRGPVGVFVVETLDEPAPPLDAERAGLPVVIPEPPFLVHFWATWCAPCAEELPGLLAAAEAEGVPLIAITDEPWPVVRAWFRGEVPAAVATDARGGASAAWQVSSLPETFVVRAGRIDARVGGARDWSSADARRFLREEVR